MVPDPRLLDFCTTEKQTEKIEAWIKHGSFRKAAAALGFSNKSSVSNAVNAVRAKAALHGYAPDHDMTRPAAPGYTVKGTSTLYDKDGHMAAQWVKTTADQTAKQERFEAMLAELCEGVEGRSNPAPLPKSQSSDLINVIPMGDPHCGMLAWSKETGESFDLDEFERRMRGAVTHLVSSAPECDEALFINLGDFFHSDNESNRTPASGNPLDVDGRFAKVAMIAFRSMVHAIDLLKAKHRKVTVWNKPGNHDPHSYLMLAMSLNAYYSNDDRVDVPVDPCMFSYMRFGNCLFASTHGHGPKINDLPLIMAADRKEDWGVTEHRFWFIGHFHHKQKIQDLTGCTVEIARTLANGDAWHHGKGYRSQSDMQCITLHREHGEVYRTTCNVSMIG